MDMGMRHHRLLPFVVLTRTHMHTNAQDMPVQSAIASVEGAEHGGPVTVRGWVQCVYGYASSTQADASPVRADLLVFVHS